MIADSYSGVVADLDVLPLASLDEIVGDRSYLFVPCSRKGVIANDLLYTSQGLPGILEHFRQNLKRLDQIEIYKTWKMRYVFRSTGPDFFTSWVKKAGLQNHVCDICDRTFLDPKQRRRNVKCPRPLVYICHHLSWADHVNADCGTRIDHGRAC